MSEWRDMGDAPRDADFWLIETAFDIGFLPRTRRRWSRYRPTRQPPPSPPETENNG